MISGSKGLMMMIYMQEVPDNISKNKYSFKEINVR